MVHPLLGYIHKDLVLKLFYYVYAIYHVVRTIVSGLIITTGSLIPVKLTRLHQAPRPAI